jgi:hypothetical protein
LGRLLGSRHVDDEGAVCGATDLEGPWTAADVAVPNELTFALRVDVYVDVLEAVGASDSRGVIHWGPRIHEGAGGAAPLGIWMPMQRLAPVTGHLTWVE